MDGKLSRSDMATCTYLLLAIFSDAAERRRDRQDQEALDIKGVWNDLKIRLQLTFQLTKDQLVCGCIPCSWSKPEHFFV